MRYQAGDLLPCGENPPETPDLQIAEDEAQRIAKNGSLAGVWALYPTGPDLLCVFVNGVKFERTTH